MQLSVENVRPYSMINGLLSLGKSEKVNTKPETKLLLQQKEGQLNIIQMAKLLEQTAPIPGKAEIDAKRLIRLMDMELGEGVKNADHAALQVIKDIATGKIDFEKIKESPDNRRFQVDGANGKTYGVLVTIGKDGKVAFWATEGSREEIAAFVSGEAQLSFDDGVFSNTKALEVLPQVYAQIKHTK